LNYLSCQINFSNETEDHPMVSSVYNCAGERTMKKLGHLFLVSCLTVSSTILVTAAAPQIIHAGQETKDMYRLYNPNSGEHFYTANASEQSNLVSLGWSYEGIGWTAPASSNTPVFRMYNDVGGEHHYTTSADERDYLVTVGWIYEGIGWYSDDNKSIPLYRQYNPNAYSCNHNYTASKDENDWLASIGWSEEGIAWYGMNPGTAANVGNVSQIPYSGYEISFTGSGDNIWLSDNGQWLSTTTLYPNSVDGVKTCYYQGRYYELGESLGYYTDGFNTREYFKAVPYTDPVISASQANYSYEISDASYSKDTYADAGYKLLFIKTNNPDPSTFTIADSSDVTSYLPIKPYKNAVKSDKSARVGKINDPSSPGENSCWKAADNSGYYMFINPCEEGPLTYVIREKGRQINGTAFTLNVKSKAEYVQRFNACVDQLPAMAGVTDSMSLDEKLTKISFFICDNFYYPTVEGVDDFSENYYTCTAAYFMDLPVASCVEASGYICTLAMKYGADSAQWVSDESSPYRHMTEVVINGVKHYYSDTAGHQLPADYNIVRYINFK
jgi:hypothetical protein